MKKWIYSAVALSALALGTPVALADDVTLEDLPQEVRRTVERELGEAHIGEIERDDERGRTYYEIEFIQNGRRFELDVAEDGEVIRRHRD